MAAWKPKEKELTAEEAIALARKELLPWWLGSGPLLAGVPDASGAVNAVPLDPDFHKSSWLIWFVDPSSLEGALTCSLAHHFQKRYGSLPVKFLMVLEPAFDFQRNREEMENFLKQKDIRFPAVVDSEGLLGKAFGSHKGVRVALLPGGGRPPVTDGSAGWLARVEPFFQKYLRVTDPGLPLRPFRDVSALGSQPLGSLDLGFRRPGPLQGKFPGTGPLRSGVFRAAGPALEPGQFRLKGTWIQDAEKIGTSDPDAELHLLLPGGELYLVGCSLAKISESARITVESKGTPIYETFCGNDLSTDEEGHSSLRLEEPRLYHVLSGLSPDLRLLTLRFPQSARTPVGIYGLRFGA